jgi:methylmalonyl-CoA epimerase
MKATLDHIGIAVKDLGEALAFYRDTLGLEIEAAEDVPSQRVRAHFVPLGDSSLELLEATAPDSPIAKYVDKRGPGLHHITLRVENIETALSHLKARGARLIDEQPRPGAEGALVAFVHPSSAHGVLVELKQVREVTEGLRAESPAPNAEPVVAGRETTSVARYTLGDLQLVSLSDGFFRIDGGAMFGVVPKTAWSTAIAADDANCVRLAMRPLLVRGTRTMLIDAGLGDKNDERVRALYGIEERHALDRSLAGAGVQPEAIDVVLATHLHADHAGGFTIRDASGQLRPRFPRARYVVRRGEWEEATHADQQSGVRYSAGDFVPLADAGVLALVDDDQTIMPGVRVERTGGHTRHHQAIWLESRGQRAVYPGDLVPTAAHLRDAWIAGLDLYPVETLAAKKALLKRAVAEHALVLFAHDPTVGAGYITEEQGEFRLSAEQI